MQTGVRTRLRIGADRVERVVQRADDGPWKTQAVVRKGRIRSISPSAGGIGVSERSRFGARGIGRSLIIPETLPNFEEVKEMLESWRAEKP